MRRELARAAIGLLIAALITGLAGNITACGSGEAGGRASSPGAPPDKGQLRLLVTRDFGGTTMVDRTVAAGAGSTVMRLLAGQTKVKTAYGGGFINAIDGLESSFGDDDPADWFYWVDGRMGEAGAMGEDLTGGETVWWDFHRWRGAMSIPAALHALPAPWSDGRQALAGDVAVDDVAAWARRVGIQIAAPTPLTETPAAGALVVATPRQVAATPWLSGLIGRGPEAGLFVSVGDEGITSLDRRGRRAGNLTACAVAAPNPRRQDATLLLLLGEESELPALLDRLTPAAASARVGLGLNGSSLEPLPAGEQEPDGA